MGFMAELSADYNAFEANGGGPTNVGPTNPWWGKMDGEWSSAQYQGGRRADRPKSPLADPYPALLSFK